MIACSVIDGIAVVRLNRPPVHALDFELLDRLCAALAAAADDPSVEAILLRGDDHLFSAGADLDLFRRISTREEAVTVSRSFQTAFQRIEDCPKLVVAAVAGTVAGGALELAAACHLRIAAADAKFVMPEVRLGINPGAGGTVRLPRLVGLRFALEMMLRGTPIGSAEALAQGLIDRIIEPTQWLSTLHDDLRNQRQRLGSLSRCSQLQQLRTSQRSDRLETEDERTNTWRWAEEVVAAIRPELVAPGEIVRTVRVGIEESATAGLLAENEAFARCMATASTQDIHHVFFARRRAEQVLRAVTTADRSSQREVRAAEFMIRRAAVIGLGTMGSGIAQALAEAGLNVVGIDPQPAALAAAQRRIADSWQRRLAQGRLSAAEHAALTDRLTLATEMQPAETFDLLVEAVIEDEAVKRRVLNYFEPVVAPEGFLASNTSTIPLGTLAVSLKRPSRLVGMHFFHPAQAMPLVEIIPHQSTDPDIPAKAAAVVKRMKKTPLFAADRTGFVVNRLFIPYLKEAFWLLHEGIAPRAIDQAMVAFGFAMGPMQLIDMSGLDILLHTDIVMQRAFPHHGPLSPIVAQLVSEGWLGRKTGIGVYRYVEDDRTPLPNHAAERLFSEIRREHALINVSPPEEITDRLVLRLAVEAFRALDEQLVERPTDLDLALVLGTGLAEFRGGILRYAYRFGLRAIYERLTVWAQRFGPRYAPPASLQIAAEENVDADCPLLNPLWRQYLQERPDQ